MFLPMIGRTDIIWNCRGREVVCGSRTLVMGILNVTPDSFSDGGRFQDLGMAVTRGLQMVTDGADIIDVGGESTRPGSNPVPVEEEIRRVVPVIEALRGRTRALISVDTWKAEVARAAVAVGADIINDINAARDPGMTAVVAESGAGLVLMHMKGNPQTMQVNPHYHDAVSDVRKFLEERMTFVIKRGVAPEQICLDPGIGFGKNDVHNLALLNGIPELLEPERPLLVGVSRKSLFGRLLGRETNERLAGSLSTAVFAVLHGAHILRVHDVLESCDAVKVVDTLRAQGRRE